MDSAASFFSVCLYVCVDELTPQAKPARSHQCDQGRAVILHFQLLIQACLSCICTYLLRLLFADPSLASSSPIRGTIFSLEKHTVRTPSFDCM